MNMRTHGVEIVDELVHANLEAETAFTVCAYATRSDRFGAMLLARAVLCGEAACSLSAMLGTPECTRESEVTSRPGSPDWVALHDAMLTHDDAAVREECVRIEEAILVRFRDLLEYDLPADLQRLVEKYFAGLLEPLWQPARTRPAGTRKKRRPNPLSHRAPSNNCRARVRVTAVAHEKVDNEIARMKRSFVIPCWLSSAHVAGTCIASETTGATQKTR
jgi:hypothetical protein